jgi:hypothetical protein
MKKISLILGAVGALMSLQTHAVLITHGNLSFENTGNTIEGDGREYIRFDYLTNILKDPSDSAAGTKTLADLTFAETESLLVFGGALFGFRIATRSDADFFLDSFFSGPNTCSGQTGAAGGPTAGVPVIDPVACGSTFDWVDGDFGNNYSTSLFPSSTGLAQDFVFFLTEGENGAGAIRFDDTFDLPGTPSFVIQDEVVASIDFSDAFAAGGANSTTPISWLLVKDGVAPEPSVLALFGLGLLGLGAFRRGQKV